MTLMYHRSTKSRTAKVTMCIILERTAPSPLDSDGTLRNSCCRRHGIIGFEVQDRPPTVVISNDQSRHHAEPSSRISGCRHCVIENLLKVFHTIMLPRKPRF